MRIQERTGVGAGRAGVPAQPPVGERLPAPPRERKPALAALAVLLILVGALGATTLVLRVGDRVEVVRVTADIQAGESVTKGNTRPVMVAADPDINYVRWEQLDTLSKLEARTTIYAGTVVVGDMFGNQLDATKGRTLVGLSLEAGRYPTGIRNGDVVDAYLVGAAGRSGSGSGEDSPASSGGGLLVERAVVADVPKADSDDLVSSSNKAVTLAVDPGDAADLAQAAANGQVVLVLVPGNPGN